MRYRHHGHSGRHEEQTAARRELPAGGHSYRATAAVAATAFREICGYVAGPPPPPPPEPDTFDRTQSIIIRPMPRCINEHHTTCLPVCEI